MRLFRLLLVLALMPVTAYSGMPRVACQCSNGELRLHCPKLEQATTASASRIHCCQRQQNVAPRSRCCRSQAAHAESNPPIADQAASCESGCQCTPVWLASDVGPTLSKVTAPEPVQIDLYSVPMVASGHSQQAFVTSKAIDTGPVVAIDFVIAYERFLI